MLFRAYKVTISVKVFCRSFIFFYSDIVVVMKMTEQIINIAVSRSLLGRPQDGRLPQGDHMVWRGAYGFGYRPRGYAPTGAPKDDDIYNGIIIADDKVPIDFLRHCEKFNNCGDFNT